MHKNLNIRLETLKKFQDKYPTSHVGGSLGLFLHGVDLKRDLSNSDLDITIDEFELNGMSSDYTPRSDSNDFDYAIQEDYPNGLYVKMDIRITPEPWFDVIEYLGCNYNVSKRRDILFWKQKYADKGVLKHQDDLETIKTGIRPNVVIMTSAEIEADDKLPF